MFRDEMKKAAEDFGLTLSENQLVQFTRYYELLVEWNEKMNLTATRRNMKSPSSTWSTRSPHTIRRSLMLRYR